MGRDYIVRAAAFPAPVVSSRVLERATVVLCLATALSACGPPRIPPPPALFPLENAWKVPVPGGVDHGPATDGARVFYVSAAALHAVAAADGKPLWTTAGREGTLGAGPGLLALREADGTVWGIEPASGSARWKVESGIAGTLPPVVDAERVLVAGDGIVSIDVGSGRVVWGAPGAPKVTAPPVVAGALVIVGEADGTVRARDAATGESRWTHATGGEVLAPALPDGEGRLILGTTARGIIALDAKDGKREWRWRVGADVTTGGIVVERNAVVATQEAVLWGLRRGGGNMAWRAALPSRTLGGPIRFGDAVLIACHGLRPSESLLVGFDGLTGRRLGDLKTPAELKWPPAAAGRGVYAALRDDTLAGWRLPAEAEPAGSSPAKP
jgi:outer membrane protein assembly factor BamB